MGKGRAGLGNGLRGVDEAGKVTGWGHRLRSALEAHLENLYLMGEVVGSY